MRELPPVLALLALFALVVLVCAVSWRGRARAQERAGLPAPSAGEVAGAGDPAGAPGVYVCTTLAREPLQRVHAHRLGERSRALIDTTATTVDGSGAWRIAREGAPDVLIPVADIREVTTAPGMAGKWIGGDGLVLIRWRLGETEVDTGLRMDDRADHDQLLQRGADLAAPAPTPDKELS